LVEKQKRRLTNGIRSAAHSGGSGVPLGHRKEYIGVRIYEH